MVNDIQQSSFNELCLHDRSHNFDKRFLREDDSTFGNGVNITCKMEILQIVKEVFLEKACASQVINIFRFKMQILDIINGLIQTAGDGIGAAAWILAVKNVKYNTFLGMALEVALHHGQFI